MIDQKLFNSKKMSRQNIKQVLMALVIILCLVCCVGCTNFQKTIYIIEGETALTKAQIDEVYEVLVKRMELQGVNGTIEKKQQSVHISLDKQIADKIDIEQFVISGAFYIYNEDWDVLIDNTNAPLIESADIRHDESKEYGQYSIEIIFFDKWREKISLISEEYIGKTVYMVIDGNLYTAPYIRESINDGRFLLDDIEKEQDAKMLQYLFSAGYIPYKLLVK